MAKKRVLSVCGTGGVTSSVITRRVKEIAEENAIDVEITNSNAFSIKSHLDSEKYDLIVSSSRVKSPDENIPVINCMSFLTGVNEEATIGKILEVLKQD
ncbi:PTS sugar transporter subunit IIB [Pelolinea submarina]|uniref:PTS system IIB component (Gat family) n=1 Tax=Pelolinea submarina TaxID=913107 RepID=A0A3E0AFT0_9CHLR|nr:PTS sugar transporter subunit IIB [Pelolinea submarina]REG10501.1 PTS system IIB component (Gat family) [Pelolinea submarina]